MRSKSISLQITSTPQKRQRGANGLGNGPTANLKLGINSRTFETRFTPRYKKMPPLPKNLPAPNFSQSANRILQERYLLKGGDLKVVETVAQRFWHVAFDIASAECDFGSSEQPVMELAKKFYGMMIRQEFLPNSPTIMNAGKQNGLQYSACFVLPVDDSLVDIFDAIKYAALIHQTGGGTGFAFSRLRPSGSMVKTSGGVASGPVSFLRVFDAATNSIKQGGTRRGANMGILRVDHPDIMDFIRCKADLDDQNQPAYDGIAPFLPNDEVRAHFKTLLLDTQISNFNISVAMTDQFMEAYYHNGSYDLVDPRTKEKTGSLNAREVFDEIIERAWHTGDPGVVFIDRINNSPANPVPELEEIEATNPCGEQPLAAWDACNLGSINLGKVVLEDGSDIDWEALRQITHDAVHFLDNVVQVNPYTLPQIYEEVYKNRRIGLGIMGWADMLFRLKIPYDSEQAVELGEKVMKFINGEAIVKSQDLATLRGPFPNFAHSRYKHQQPRRNGTVTTIAPTGTISIIGDCSSGIEPVFALAYIHRAVGAGNKMRYLTIANKTFTQVAKKEGFFSDGLTQKVMDNGSVSGIETVPEDWQKVFVTASEIAPDWHVKMQAAFQKHTENGVSKTINLPNSATRDDVKKAYLMAWETGCKGITVYRDGSKTTQVLNVASTLKPADNQAQLAQQESELLAKKNSLGKRPIILRGRTYKINSPVGEAFITINRDSQDQPFEVFVAIGKAGMQTSADAEAIGRLISLALRVNRPNALEIAHKIIAQLRGIGGSSQIGFGKDRVMSLADAVAKALAEDLSYSSYQDQPEEIPLELNEPIFSGDGETTDQSMLVEGSTISSQTDLCPDCGNPTLVLEEGCSKCYSCGYAKC